MTKKEMEWGWRMVIDPRTEDFDSSTMVTFSMDVDDKMLENKLGLLVIWSVIPESMTHLVDEEKVQQFMLLESAMIVISVDDEGDALDDF